MDTPGSGSLFRRNPVLEALRDRFEVQGLLGHGAMGAVFRCRERATGRPVALKVALEAERDPRRLERFRREGQITAGLQHPGIVGVHSAGEAGGFPYVAYELVEGGRTLADALPPLEPRARVELVRDAARALGFAHRAGVVHRDVKPENVLIDPAGRVRVADFGLAAARGLERLTRTGASVGTPAYMSPEQLGGRREDVGPQADVWALGVMLYLALTGTLPFEAANLVELSARIITTEPEPPRRVDPSVDRELEAVCLRALRKLPGERYPDGEALADDLDRALAGVTTQARGASASGRAGLRRLLVVGAAVALVVSALIASALVERAPPVTAKGSDAPPPPALHLSAPAEGAEVWSPAVAVTGRVEGGAPPIEVVVVAPVAAAARLERAGEFSVTVEVAPGDAQVVVEARDAAGRIARVERAVVRRATPGWFDQAAARPPLPLPGGVSFGEAPGEYVNDRDGSTLVWVPPGTFVMGSDRDEERERPAHRVRLSRGFFLGKFEVTLAQWRRFCAETGRPSPTLRDGADDRHPVADATYPDARAYCDWAGLRLPTEAEWEYAARGPDSLRYPWGPRFLPGRMNSGTDDEDDGVELTAPVGSFPAGASPFGALDMAGNVYEWVADWYADGYPVSPGEERVDPIGPSSGTRRVLRGGAYNCGTIYCRGSDRFPQEGDVRWLSNLGVRVARSAQ